MIYFYFLVAIFGLIIGSFLNALIFRLHSGDSIASGRSKCPTCKHVLGVGDLIPVFSFIFLGGRCRYCQKSVSWQYPLVELATAILFLLFFHFHYSQDLSILNILVLCVRDWLVASALIVVFVYDWRWMMIPDSVVLPVVVIVLIVNIFLGQSVLGLLLSLIIGFGFFAIQYFISRGSWIGGGDLRLGLLMGSVLVWQNVILAILLAYIIGAIWAVWLLVSKRAGRKTEIPFGVFLAPATIIAMLYGDRLINWYFSLL